ncbi:MAG: hypothetical protein AB7G93_22140 [Bdellovibrionales bacterium]
MKAKEVMLTLAAIVSLTACGKGSTSYSLLASGQTFQQNSAQDTKVDVLWMVDASATMANHQSNLANNFDHFINQFVAKGLNFNMAVAGVDAWLREFNYNAGTCTVDPNPTQDPDLLYTSSADCKITAATFGDLTQFRDGDVYGPIGGSAIRSGTFLLTSGMPALDIKNLFAINIKTGTRGDGVRESAFQSLRAVLRRNEDGSVGYNGESHTALASFRRDDAFLAVIIVTDEEDQGRKADNTAYADIQEYTDAFVAFMDGYTGGTAGDRRYNVSGIVLEDKNNCPYNLNSQATQGDRYVSIATATKGVIGNICSADFSEQLDIIASQIVSLATRFKIKGEPVPGTIRVSVDGVVVPQDETNGWTYVAEGGSHYIEFDGSAVPPQGSQLSVNYDPASLEF